MGLRCWEGRARYARRHGLAGTAGGDAAAACWRRRLPLLLLSLLLLLLPPLLALWPPPPLIAAAATAACRRCCCCWIGASNRACLSPPPPEIHKNKDAWIPVCADMKPALQGLNRILQQQPVDQSQVRSVGLLHTNSLGSAARLGEGRLARWLARLAGAAWQGALPHHTCRPLSKGTRFTPCVSPGTATTVVPLQYADWVAEVMAMKQEHPLSYPLHDDVIMPQWAIEVGVLQRGGVVGGSFEGGGAAYSDW